MAENATITGLFNRGRNVNSGVRKLARRHAVLALLLVAVPAGAIRAQNPVSDAEPYENAKCARKSGSAEKLFCREDDTEDAVSSRPGDPDNAYLRKKSNTLGLETDTHSNGTSQPTLAGKTQRGSNAKRSSFIEMMDVPSGIDSDDLLVRSQDIYEGATPLPFTARIESVSTSEAGTFFIRLDNGELWREAAGNRVDAPESGGVVEVYRGRTGGYRIRVKDRPGIIWVHPVK